MIFKMQLYDYQCFSSILQKKYRWLRLLSNDYESPVKIVALCLFFVKIKINHTKHQAFNLRFRISFTVGSKKRTPQYKWFLILKYEQK
jgi:hypothetical protein